MPGIRCYQVNAFTPSPFAGNPATVCLLDSERPDEWMQAVAAEFNLADTAFLVRGGDAWQLRWFTPRAEVALCGHATLATAYVLWHLGEEPVTQTIRFQTRSGQLTAERRGDWIQLDFPATPVESIAPSRELSTALNVQPVGWGQSEVDLLVELASAAEVRAVQPDLIRLRQIPTRGVIVTARGDEPGIDFISRFFAPALGIDEDPVTGSTHCALAPWWKQKLGKTTFTARQVSERGGLLQLEIQGERVLLRGQAALIWQGELLV